MPTWLFQRQVTLDTPNGPPRGARGAGRSWDHVLSRARRPTPPATPVPRDVTGGPIQWLGPAPAGA
eukprot:2838921-Pyramimonas_sp.AAC.1